jgi:PHD/YefM family antitoxin component YafN of YafNO toxin-antitoxin module
MPLMEFEGWQETVHLLKSPANSAALLESMRQARLGNFVGPAAPDAEAT